MGNFSAKIQSLKSSVGITRYLYPPEWHHFKIWFTPQAMAPIKIWVAVIPFLAGMISLFPIDLLSGDLNIRIGGEFKPPFSMMMSYFAALLYLISFGLFLAFGPDFVRKNHAVFDRLPDNVTRSELVQTLRQATVQKMPRRFSLKSGATYELNHLGYFSNVQYSIECAPPPSEAEAEEIEVLWNKTADYTTNSLLKIDHTRFQAFRPSRDLTQFYKDDGFTMRPAHPDFKVGQALYEILFVPTSTFEDRSEGANAAVSNGYTSVFFALAESRALPRAIIWTLLYLSALLGIIVLVQILLRGVALFLSLPTM